MPELPEVEIVRRGLEPVMVGHRITSVELRRADLRFPFPEGFAARLQGRRVTAVTRRAKYILVHLDSGDVVILHLGMTGRVTVVAKDTPRGTQAARALGDYVYEAGEDPKHDHVRFHLSSGATITYNDPRRFGFMLLTTDGALAGHPLMRGLGDEPLGNVELVAHLARKAEGRRADLKAFLMDQRVVAGLGNIYVCEALNRAGLSPKRMASCLAGRGAKARERAARVAEAIQGVLTEAIAAGGSTLNDYRQADGSPGAFQKSHRVYGREGQPCPNCGGTVRRIVQGGRSTFYCPRCQR